MMLPMRLCAAAVAIGLLSLGGGAFGQTPLPAGVDNPQRAWQDWTLNCQGCHRPDGTGTSATAPSLAGTVAKFLWVLGGREYLGRVPGVATSALSIFGVAEACKREALEKENLPSNFQPYTAAEVGRLRTQPLRLEAAPMRADLLKRAGESGRP